MLLRRPPIEEWMVQRLDVCIAAFLPLPLLAQGFAPQQRFPHRSPFLPGLRQQLGGQRWRHFPAQNQTLGLGARHEAIHHVGPIFRHQLTRLQRHPQQPRSAGHRLPRIGRLAHLLPGQGAETVSEGRDVWVFATLSLLQPLQRLRPMAAPVFGHALNDQAREVLWLRLKCPAGARRGRLQVRLIFRWQQECLRQSDGIGGITARRKAFRHVLPQLAGDLGLRRRQRGGVGALPVIGVAGIGVNQREVQLDALVQTPSRPMFRASGAAKLKAAGFVGPSLSRARRAAT